ncbi:MAG: hypothetical protein RR325_00305 [Bacilli bacterium]
MKTTALLINYADISKKSIVSQLQNVLKAEKAKELCNLEIDNKIDDKRNELACIESDYERYFNKLYFVKTLDENSAVWKKYVEMLHKTDNIGDISFTRKVEMMLAYPMLLIIFDKIDKLSDSELFMVADAAGELDFEDFSFYIAIIGDSMVASSIVNSGFDFKEQNKIAKKIMDTMDEMNCEYVDADNFNMLKEAGLQAINEYSNNKHNKML